MPKPKTQYHITATAADGTRQSFPSVTYAAAALDVEPNEIVRAIFLHEPLRGLTLARGVKAKWVTPSFYPCITTDELALVDKLVEIGGFKSRNSWFTALIRGAITTAIPKLREAGAIPTPKLPITHGRDDYE